MSDINGILAVIGECHRQLQDHAIRLRNLAAVREVSHSVYMPLMVDAFRLQEFVEAEIQNGEEISWCFEVTLTTTDISVEADVRRNHSRGQEVLETLGEFRFSAEAECSVLLPEITTRLCALNPL